MSRSRSNTTIAVLTSTGLSALITMVGLILIGNKASAESSAVSTAAITVPVACTMRGTGTESHTATLAPNTYSGASDSEYENGIGKTTLAAICNDDNGFSIYAIGYTGNQYSGENHTKLVGTNTGGTITTKAYQSGDTTSNWSMKLTKVTDASESYNPQNLTIQSDTEGSFDIWHSIPDTFTKVAEYHANTGSSTTDTTLGVKLETTYAAYIASNQPADIYEGQVKYTMVHPYTEEPLQPQPATAGCINYHANASNAIGTMGCQSATDNASIELFASNFSRTGYGFAGWSDAYDYATNANAHFYGPQETITVPEGTTTNGLSLYAVWVKSEGNLQDTTKVTTLCGTGTGSLTKADEATNILSQSITALSDARDSNTYAIAKLADGKCWMIENLRLADEVSENNKVVLTTTNTNNPLNTDGTVTIKNDDGNTTNHLSPTSNSWCTWGSSDCNDQSKLNTLNINEYTSQTSSSYSSSGNVYSYGNYYNWYSATAGKGTYSKSSGSVDGDLCPKGWQLPIGAQSTADSSFGALSVALGGPTGGATANSSSIPTGTMMSGVFRSFPNDFLYSGFFSGSSTGGRGSYGYYWSSTANDSIYSYPLYLNNSIVNPGTVGGSKYIGGSIRCVSGS